LKLASQFALIATAAWLVAACGVSSPAGSTGGTSEPAGACGRGLVVVDVGSDYQSSNVSLVGYDGRVLSQSLISSASASTGLSEPLSGDVVAPTTSVTGDEVVLVDRYPAGVLTWVNVHTGHVRAQLSVSPGFPLDPQDYLLLSGHEAYVPRLDSNTSPGKQPFDKGNDVLVVDPSVPKITASIDMTPAMKDAPKFLPRAHAVVEVGGSVYALLSGEAPNTFSSSASSRVVRIDPKTRAIAEVLVLEGLHGCTALAVSPNSDELAVSCFGTFSTPTSLIGVLGQSGVALVGLGAHMTDRARFKASDLGTGPLDFGLAFANQDTLLITAFGASGDDDTADALDVETGRVTVLAHSTTEFGQVRCAPACGVCFVADPGAGLLRRYAVDASSKLTEIGSVRPDPDIGLPPRLLGGF
jgi:hypothetical protein